MHATCDGAGAIDAMENEPQTAENWKALDSLRKQVNDFLKFGTNGSG